MNNELIEIAFQVLRLANNSIKVSLLWLFGLNAISAILDLVSLTAIVPFISLLVNAQAINNPDNIYLSYILVGFSFLKLEPVYLFALFLVLIVVLSSYAKAYVLRKSLKISAELATYIGKTAFQEILSMDYITFKGKNSANLIAVLTKQLDITSLGFTCCLQIISSALTVIAILISAIIAKTLIFFPTLASLFVIYAIISKKDSLEVNMISRKINILNKNKIIALQESFQSYKEIKINSLDAKTVERFECIEEKIREADAHSTFLSRYPKIMIEGLSIVLIVGVALVLQSNPNNPISIGQLAFVTFAIQKFAVVAQQIYQNILSLNVFKESMAEVLDFLRNNLIKDKAKTSEIIKFNCFKDKLVFTEISYNYKDSLKLFDNVKFEICPSDFIGIYGASGSGKSTLLDIIVGLFKPSSGSIKIYDYAKDKSYALQNHKSISQLFSLVPQEVCIINDSIYNNLICYSGENVTNNVMNNILKLCHLNGLVDSLPNGINHILAENGKNLSGGQKQRIGIARALTTNKPILVLDEATSALDSPTEKSILNHLKNNLKDKAKLMVTHKPENLLFCNKILYFKEGRIKLIESSNIREFVNNQLFVGT